MLYNRAWKTEHIAEVKPDILPDICLDDFIAWLETKNPNETYDYTNKTGQCCLGQYMADRGIEWPRDWSPIYKAVGRAVGGHSPAFQSVLSGRLGGPERRVPFGETLERAKDYQRIKKSMENA